MKSFKEFISESKQFKNPIKSICQKYYITDYTINLDGSIDVDGSVNLAYNNLTKLPLKFGKVSGSFDCRYNNLETLEGCPKEVGGDFYCSDNKLTTLVGCPVEVRRFLGGDNLFSDLTGCPQFINGDFNVSDNKNLVSLKGGPKKVKGYYSFGETGLLDPSGLLEDKEFIHGITFEKTPFCNVLSLFLSNGFGYNCGCVDLNNCNHIKDNEYIYQMISTIIDMGIINGNEINLDKLYMLY